MGPAAGPASAIGGLPGLSVSSGPALAEGTANGTSTTGAFSFGTTNIQQTSWTTLLAIAAIGGLILWRTR